ncbi:HAD family hydrolase [Candidatus Omnitrophota bacterium]
MKKVELIIFDLDGTLVDSKEAIARQVNLALKEVGLKEKEAPEIISYIGTGVDDLVRKSLGDEHQHLFEQAKDVLENYRRDFEDDSQLYPGVKELLEYFKTKSKAIISNRKYEFVLPMLERLEIGDYFERVIGGDNEDCLKPAPCSLDKMISEAQVDKGKVIMVGDMDLDVLAGKNAGVLTCAVTYGLGKREDIIRAQPDYMIGNMLQLKDIIE